MRIGRRIAGMLLLIGLWPLAGQAGDLLTTPLFELKGSFEAAVGGGDLFFLAARDPDPEEPDVRVFRLDKRGKARQIGTYFTTGATLGMALRDGYLYLANGDRGLEVVDVRDPARPAQAAELALAGYTHRVVLSGGLAYLASGFGGLQIVDVSDPWRPRLVGSYRAFPMPGEPEDEDVGLFPKSGDAQPVAAAPAEQGYYDADDLPAYEGPEPNVSPEEFATKEGVMDLAVGRGRAYLAYASAGLVVVDVNDPRHPVRLGSVDLGGPVESVRLDGDRLGVTAGIAGVQTLDVSDPVHPRVLGELRTICYPQGLARTGGYTYVADGYCGSDALLVMKQGDGDPVLLESHPGIVGNVSVVEGRLFAMGLEKTRVYALP